MKMIGIFEAKTHLSEICEEVASTHEPVTVTKRGKPLVRIDPANTEMMTIRERRERYMTTYGCREKDDDEDFTPPQRSKEISEFHMEN